MGSLIGKITGTTKAANKAAAAQRDAADKARFRPWEISGSDFYGKTDFDIDTQTATYNLSPQLQQLQNQFMTAIQDPTADELAFPKEIQDYGINLFRDAAGRDINALATDQYNDIQNIMAPQRAQQEQGLLSNLYGKGRTGMGISSGAGGYLNPERHEYLTSKDRTDKEFAMQAFDRARSMQNEDISNAFGNYGMAESMRQMPYDRNMGLFNLGNQMEEYGRTPMNLGMQLGAAAQPGNNAWATGLNNAANTQQSAALANAGMFMNLLGTAAGQATYSPSAGWGYGNKFMGGSQPGGYVPGSTGGSPQYYPSLLTNSKGY
jgi:hypothetical protein